MPPGIEISLATLRDAQFGHGGASLEDNGTIFSYRTPQSSQRYS